MTDTMEKFAGALDRFAASGQKASFWLRDDDAVLPTAALDRLIELTATHGVPLTLAVIPEETGPDLAARLGDAPHVTVAVHGWSHRNHAGHGRKRCELGLDRPRATVLADLAQGLAKLRKLHGDRLFPLLVPPWNRIDETLFADLPAVGFTALSTFGPERPAPVAMLNTHVDLIDWHGSRGGRSGADLIADLEAALQAGIAPVGLLTHHLMNDDAAWRFLDRFIALTAMHPACRWLSSPEILARTVA